MVKEHNITVERTIHSIQLKVTYRIALAEMFNRLQITKVSIQTTSICYGQKPFRDMRE